MMSGERITELVVATTNRGKLGELRRLLGERGVKVRGLDEFGGLAEAVEDGETFAANARLKGVHYGELIGGWVLADDSGLEVEVLGGQPGVRSARFAGVAGSGSERDGANNRKLLGLLAEVPGEQRGARFCCCLCLVQVGEVRVEVEGCCNGVIGEEARGTNGFGYDPLFCFPELGKTAAELDSATKNSVSHRGAALRKLVKRMGPWLEG